MSDMEETGGTPELPEGSEVPAAPHRVIGTPPPSPRLLGGGDGGAGAAGQAHGGGGWPSRSTRWRSCRPSPTTLSTPRTAEKVVAALFLLAFLAGCGFIAAYIGLGSHGWTRSCGPTWRWAVAVGHAARARPRRADLGPAPDAGRGGGRGTARHALDRRRRGPRSRSTSRKAAGASQFVKRPMVRRTLMLGHPAAGRRPAGAAARHGPAARDQPAAHGVEPGPPAAGLRHQHRRLPRPSSAHRAA